MPPEIIKCALWVEGEAEEVRRFAATFEGTSFGSAPAPVSFERVLPAPRGITGQDALSWRTENWGTPRDVLCDERLEDFADDDDERLECEWLLATLDEPPIAFAKRVSGASWLHVRIAYARDGGWGSVLFHRSWTRAYCFIARDSDNPETRAALAHELLEEFNLWTDLDEWSHPGLDTATSP